MTEHLTDHEVLPSRPMLGCTRKTVNECELPCERGDYGPRIRKPIFQAAPALGCDTSTRAQRMRDVWSAIRLAPVSWDHFPIARPPPI